MPLEWLPVPALQLAYGMAVVLVAGIVRGFAGFGFSALTVAGMSLFISPAQVVPVAFVLEVLASLSLEREGQPQRGTEVQVVRLSKYIDRPVDLLKIDVEGAEGMVLEDLAAAKKLVMVKQMIIEYHHHLRKDVDALSKFLRILEDHGFGYQIETSRSAFARVAHPPNEKMAYQDVAIFAYRKPP